MNSSSRSYHHINTSEEQSTFNDGKFNSMERSTELVTIMDTTTNTSSSPNNDNDYNIKDDIADDKLLFDHETFEEIPLEKDTPITKDSIDHIPNRRGFMCMFLYNSQGAPRICIGPHWPFTLCLLSFISVICAFYFYGLWNVLNIYVRNVGLSIAFTQIGSYMMTFLMNPGLPPKEDWLENNALEISSEKNYTICQRCKVIRREEDETQHCEECDVCVMGYDHHCPWTSKCIGKRNLIPFYVFVSFTFVLLFFLIFGIFSIAATMPEQIRKNGNGRKFM